MTLILAGKSLDFFKSAAKKHNASYQTMIRRLIDYYVQEKTYDEIAEKVGTSTSTVSKIGQIIKYGKGGLLKAKEPK